MDEHTSSAYRVGDTVSAFHPRMLGVVKSGRVVTIGAKYTHIDFGALLGGTLRVPRHHIIDVLESNRG